jgi:hypothetical protein
LRICELERHGHASLHPELNPIEKIWALVRNCVAARNVVSFKATEVEKLTKERFEAVTAEDRSKICEHVDKNVCQLGQKVRRR